MLSFSSGQNTSGSGSSMVILCVKARPSGMVKLSHAVLHFEGIYLLTPLGVRTGRVTVILCTDARRGGAARTQSMVIRKNDCNWCTRLHHGKRRKLYATSSIVFGSRLFTKSFGSLSILVALQSARSQGQTRNGPPSTGGWMLITPNWKSFRL